MSTHLGRYLAGEYEAVWDELTALGDKVRQEPLYSDAIAVARETMRRARHNVELIVSRLRESGYEFQGDGFIPPAANVAEQIAELEAIARALPLSLRTWYEMVGEVSLMGTHPDWDYSVLIDPLVVEPVWSAIEESEYWNKGEDFTAPLSIAPDIIFKAELSGGGPDYIMVPCFSADGLLHTDSGKVLFVSYLRNSFRWGGFPGFANCDESLRPTEYLAYLTRDLLPL